jgi:signal transduction histidine kinase
VLVTPIDEGGQVAVLHDVSHFKALTQLKNEYIATASHDLKNPIMAVLGYNDLLSKAGPLNPLQEDFSKRIHGSAMQMRDLVLNLLEISRLESGAAMKQEELDLHNLLKDAVQELEDQAQAKSQTLSIEFCEAQPRVIGDPTLLQQMVRNLLGNAIKYTPQDGQITIATQIEGEQVCVTFRDTGYGVPPEDLPFIFNKFFRAQSKATQDIEGNGLGLAIVKSIAENHGGQVSVASKMGEGSTFKVNLPLLSMARVEA